MRAILLLGTLQLAACLSTGHSGDSVQLHADGMEADCAGFFDRIDWAEVTVAQLRQEMGLPRRHLDAVRIACGSLHNHARYPTAEMSDDDMAKFVASFEVHQVDIPYAAELTASGLRALARLPGLRGVRLGRLADASAGRLVECLRDAPHLEALEVTGTGLERIDASNLGSLPRLRVLRLHAQELGERGIAAISSLSSLEELSLTGLELPADATSQLAALAQLKRLRLACVSLGNRDVAPLVRLRKLEILDVSSNRINDSVLATLVALPALRTLEISSTAVTDRGMGVIARMPQLQWVALDNTGVGDAGLRELAAMPHLKGMSLFTTKISEDAVRAVRQRRPDLQIGSDF